MTKNNKLIWILQILAAIIFLIVGFLKFQVDEAGVNVFLELGMEPYGRYMIGLLEILTGFMLLTEAVAAYGAFLGLGVMIGAMIAHLTVLGVQIGGDGGVQFALLLVLFVFCLSILLVRRKQLPFL